MTDREENNRRTQTENGRREGHDSVRSGRSFGTGNSRYTGGRAENGRGDAGQNRRSGFGGRKDASGNTRRKSGGRPDQMTTNNRESGKTSYRSERNTELGGKTEHKGDRYKNAGNAARGGDRSHTRPNRTSAAEGGRGTGPANGPFVKNRTGAPERGRTRTDHGTCSRIAEHKPAGFRAPSGPTRSGTGVRPSGTVSQRPAKKPAEMEGLASRRIALRILRDVTENGAYASLSLDRNLTASGLNPADRRLVSRLVYDTLEHLLTLDYALEQVMAKPDTDIKLRNILRLGACQILLEDRVPESAATNTCVELCAELGMEPLKGVCNGILRNLVRKKDELDWPDEEKDPDLAASIRHSVPLWLVRRLRAEWGDEAERIMACHEPETSVTVHPNLLKMEDAAFEKLLNGKVWEHEPGLVPHAWRIRGMADIGQDSDFLAGNFSIQNESSMMACMAVAPKRGWQILDCCAAPGGKTCLLSEMMGGTGRVQAWELHEHRTALIAAQVKRLKLENVRPMTRDASAHREDLEMTMDAVLLDAPCSGLGALSGKPDVRYRVTEESVDELTGLQSRLLDAVCGYVKPGGVLVYSTCSILKEENENQIRAFLERHSEFTPEALPDTIPETFRRHEKVGLQLFEYRDQVEGFYMCRLRRSAR